MRTTLVVILISFVFVFVMVIALWILYGKSHSKALKALGYDNTILVYIPFVNYYMIADAALFGDEEMPLFGSLRVPANLFKFWWVLLFVLAFIPGIGSILTTVVTIVCLGTCYKRIYARLENKDESETAVIGYVSGFFPLLAVVKFLGGHYDDGDFTTPQQPVNPYYQQPQQPVNQQYYQQSQQPVNQQYYQQQPVNQQYYQQPQQPVNQQYQQPVNQTEQTVASTVPNIQRATPTATIYSKQIVEPGKQVSKSGSSQIGKKKDES